MGAAGWRGCAVDVGGVAACAWLHGRGARTVVCWLRCVLWVAGPVAGVLSWSSGCGATPSLVLNRESIA